MKQTTLITGGGRGIGYGIATALARTGANLAILDMLPEAEVADSLSQLRQAGAAVLYRRVDVTNAQDRADTMAAIRAQFGALHNLVNNAGVAPQVRADLLEATEESYERVMKINLQGPYFLTQLAAKWMIELKRQNPEYHGCIVNISSISATVASPSRGEYCLSKAGVSMATRLWACRLGEFDIPVYEIRPGVIKTPMTAAVTEKYDKLIADGLCRQARWGQPEDIGRAVAMLTRGDLAYSTGQVIVIDGGMTLQML